MAKYSFGFKEKEVQSYLNGESGYTYLDEKYGVKNKRQALNLVHSYNESGNDESMSSVEYRLSILSA